MDFTLSKTKSFFNWSGGKDSSLALYHVLNDPTIEISRLCTNLSKQYERISMHGVRMELLNQQAQSLGLPLHKTFLEEGIGMKDYDELMHGQFNDLKKEGFESAIYGDIFLEDLKEYRDIELNRAGLKGIYPLWKRNTTELVKEFINLGFKAVVVSIKSDLLDKSIVGRELDDQFIKDLPENVDPCGENGEFHSFVYDGPIFQFPIQFQMGEKVFKAYEIRKQEDENCFMKTSNQEKIGFWFCDLMPI